MADLHLEKTPPNAAQCDSSFLPRTGACVCVCARAPSFDMSSKPWTRAVTAPSTMRTVVHWGNPVVGGWVWLKKDEDRFGNSKTLDQARVKEGNAWKDLWMSSAQSVSSIRTC